MPIKLFALALSKIINGLGSGNQIEYMFQMVYYWAPMEQTVQEDDELSGGTIPVSRPSSSRCSTGSRNHSEKII